ncbi:MAG: bifunctional phosphopantothenoylcysteine decarboxylase/phosphopantothenate--cysteine ligase CoaBC [Usitatibacteraceae bacterium]
MKTVKRAPRVVLGITGGVAAYKSAELTRLLIKAGIEVQVVMTDAGTRFITPLTMQALSGQPVFIDAWDNRIDNNMAHIELSRDADAILIAPASADFLAKLANGLANDLLSTLVLARRSTCSLFVAPAMNREMWENPATQRNVARVIADGVNVLGPEPGDQACGETGMGRMAEPELLLAAIQGHLAPKSLTGIRALVTAGPTFEPIDPVRGITNSSSGKMGYAIAQALLDAGAVVTLVSGPTSVPAPAVAKMVKIRTASQMFDAVSSNLGGVELFFSVAAVSDYTPAAALPQKMKKSTEKLSLELVPTTDILAWVAARKQPPFCVGFAAESENVVEYARKKREKKKIPMIVANLATSAIGADDNEVTILDVTGERALPRASKAVIARAIVDHATTLYFAKSAHRTNLKSIKNA